MAEGVEVPRLRFATLGMTGGDGGLGAGRYVLRSLGCARDDRWGLGAWRGVLRFRWAPLCVAGLR